MSRRDKLLKRLQSKPKDFTWNELESLLGKLGYKELSVGKTGGSRWRFVHEDAPNIFLHKPHPDNVLKRYALEDVLIALAEGGFI